MSLLAVYILSDVNTLGVENSFNKRQNVGTQPLTQSLLVYRKAVTLSVTLRHVVILAGPSLRQILYMWNS